LAQCAGVGCGLIRVVVGEERARKDFSLEGPPGDGETSRLGSRDPVDGGTRCGPHGGERSKTKSEGPTRRRWDPGVSGSFKAEDTRRDRMACVGRTLGAAKA
jgi:hypothetical protein